MSNIIDSIQLSGTVYTLSAQTSGGGNPTVELTQAQYDALVTAGTVQADTYYIITDAQAGDLTNYYTKTETNTLLGGKADTATTYTKTEVDNAITAGTATKQDTLVSGTNIKTINNESILGSGNIDIQGGGGGKAVSGGTNISVTTGETADTISCTLPISAGTNTSSIKLGGGGNVEGNNSFIIGQGGIVYSDYSLSVGYNNYNTANYTFACGSGIQTTNPNQSSFGTYNKNNSNVLFSVGNGTGIARHNAFEIRQNGDIYITSGGTDIKLQDNLGGGGSSYSAGTGIDITNDVISVTGIVATSAVTSAVTSGSTDVLTSGGAYDQLGGLKLVKLTQSAYDGLSPDYDSNTLYVIVN